jgi:alpha-N-arabinofuranosidase
VRDAVVVGTYLISLLGHADRVGIGCQAQLANVIGPIRTEPGGPAWRQTTFWPFALTARLARGDALRVEPSSPLIDTAAYGPVPALTAAASFDVEAGQAALFAVNRSLTEPLTLTADLRALPGARLLTHRVLADDDLRATNTQARPDRVVPRELSGRVDDGRLTVSLPPASWNVLSFSI